MVEAAKRGLEQCNDWIEDPMRAALEAITPMVKTWGGDRYRSGYYDGYKDALTDGPL